MRTIGVLQAALRAPEVHTVAFRTITALGCSGIELTPYSIIGRMNGRSISGTFMADDAHRIGPSKGSVRLPRNAGWRRSASDVQP